MNQTELADALGVKQATISYWERGTRSPHPIKIKSIAKVLGLDPADLVPDLPDEEAPTLGYYRQLAGLSQAALAARLELHPGSIGHFETGKYWPEPYVDKWARHLGITVTQFRAAWWQSRHRRYI